MSDLSAYVAFAEELADAAHREALRWDLSEWAVENKGGGAAFDPVTRADRAVKSKGDLTRNASMPSRRRSLQPETRLHKSMAALQRHRSDTDVRHRCIVRLAIRRNVRETRVSDVHGQENRKGSAPVAPS